VWKQTNEGRDEGGVSLGGLCGLGSGAAGEQGESLWRKRLVGEKFELPPRKHAGSKVVHIGCLEMQVSQHSIGFPAANKLDQQGIDSGAKERHSTAGTEGPGGDVAGG
jgi:hypothetical protein